jgi:hypothetical protein
LSEKFGKTYNTVKTITESRAKGPSVAGRKIKVVPPKHFILINAKYSKFVHIVDIVVVF